MSLGDALIIAAQDQPRRVLQTELGTSSSGLLLGGRVGFAFGEEHARSNLPHHDMKCSHMTKTERTSAGSLTTIRLFTILRHTTPVSQA